MKLNDLISFPLSPRGRRKAEEVGQRKHGEQRTFHHPLRGNVCFSLLSNGIYSVDSC